MKPRQFVKTATLAVVLLCVLFLAGVLGRTPRVQAHEDDGEESVVQRGFAIAPVPLNLEGKNRELVGLGSYLVNAVGDCNGCHTGGGPPNFNYAAGGNPYFGQKTKVDPAVYLSGGQDFGVVGTPTGPSNYAGPDIISRNLTPDKTGRPEGGHTLQEFKQIMRHGTDFDHLHPTCTAAQIKQIETGALPFPPCIPASPDNPVNGHLLQIMPWPTFANMTDHDLEAIYEYLSAIPCIEGPKDPNNPLHNDCQ
jgi:hypothetical protein